MRISEAIEIQIDTNIHVYCIFIKMTCIDNIDIDISSVCYNVENVWNVEYLEAKHCLARAHIHINEAIYEIL